MLKLLTMPIYDWSQQQRPWTNVYGLARTLLAFSLMMTLVFTSGSDFFLAFKAQGAGLGDCEGWTRGGLFCLIPAAQIEWARWLAIIGLLVVATGWQPRLTGLLHWWISWSFMSASQLLDGGDQLAATLTLLLVPICLTDGRSWHWVAPRLADGQDSRAVARLIAGMFWLAIRVQVAYVYFQAGIEKFKVQEWADGTVLYYWFTDPKFGADQWLLPIVMPILMTPVLLTLLTWSVLVLEVFLSMGLVMDVRYRRWLLIGGVTFHVGIGVIHGLCSFATIMFAALILFLRPAGQMFARPQRVSLRRFSSHAPVMQGTD
jgi:antimicrobial peptide system SdpB family protein